MKAKIVIIAGLLALTLAVGCWLFYTHRPHTSAAQAPTVSNTATSSAPKSANSNAIASLEKSLNSADGQTQLDALTPDMRQAYQTVGKDRFLPKGTTATLKPATFAANDGFATVDVTLASSENVRSDFTLLLTRPDATSAWKILDLKQK